MCVCMYVCMCVYIYVCAYACMHICTCVCMYACMYVCVHVHIFMFIYLHTCMHACIHVVLRSFNIPLLPQPSPPPTPIQHLSAVRGIPRPRKLSSSAMPVRIASSEDVTATATSAFLPACARVPRVCGGGGVECVDAYVCVLAFARVRKIQRNCA
jgi:hypothetical protein